MRNRLEKILPSNNIGDYDITVHGKGQKLVIKKGYVTWLIPK